MKLAIALLVSICVISPPAWAQDHKLDSLLTALQSQTQEDTNRVNTLTRICYYEYTSYPEQSKRHAEEAKRIAEKLKYASGIGISLRYISLYYWVKGDYEQAANYAFRMLKVFENSGNESGLAKAYTLLGLIYEEWNDFDKSKEYHFKSLALNRKANRIYDMGYNYNSLGSLYYSAGKNEEAVEFYERSLQLRKQIKDEDGMSQSYVNLGNCAHERGDYSKEMEYYNKALPIVKKWGNINRLSLIAKSMGEIYSKSGQFSKADSLLQDALAMARQVNNKKVLRNTYHSLLLLEQSRHREGKALEYALLESAYKDSLFSEEKTRQLAEAEARYDSEKKEHAIALLTRDNKIKALWGSVLAGGVVILLLTGFFYYRIQRSANKKNKELLAIQESLNNKLKEVDKMKSHFFASISHEFRTPLTLIKGPIEQVIAHPELGLTDDTAKMIHRNSNRLLQLVNQLLDLSKLDSGNLQLENKQGDLFKFLRVIVSSFGSYAQQHAIHYKVTIPENSLFAYFDHDKLEKIIYNLISNAFKFTPDGGTIELSCQEDNSTLLIEVKDTGSGVEPAHLPYIFDRFYQVHDHTKFHEGTGIGLSLVKELVTLMRGTIHVESAPGQGTLFRISLPVTQIQVNVETPEATITGETSLREELERHLEFEKETILVIEDNDDMRSYIREHLRHDYHVLEAVNGKDGFSVACREIPDLIISDIMMPEMDGITFCGLAKKDERTSHIPIIMLTAKDGRDYKIEGLETGADEYIIKPFDARELMVRIKNLIDQRQLLRKKFGQQITLQPKNISINSVDGLFLEKVESAIEKGLSDYAFGVPQLQDAMAMSKTQLHRKMKALTDQAPGEFLRNYRLKRAAQLLEQQGGNITEVAFAVGFGSLSYFTRSFKDLFGKSPSEYIQPKKEVKQA